MKLRKYSSDTERYEHWQSILDKYSGNFEPELSIEVSEKTGIKLVNNETKASEKKLFNPKRAEKIFNHIVK